MKEQISEIINYLPLTLDEYESTERHQEAVEKLEQIPKSGFEKMLNDIINDLRRRKELEYDVDNISSKKFSKLPEQKFINLLVDIVTVYNNEYDHKDKQSDINASTSQELSLTKDLEQSFLVCCESLNFYEKILNFINISQVSDNIKSAMNNFIQQKMKADSILFFESLSSPETFIKSAESFLLQRERADKIDKIETLVLELDQINNGDIEGKDNIAKIMLNTCKEIISCYDYREISLLNAINNYMLDNIKYLKKEDKTILLKDLKYKITKIIKEIYELNLVNKKNISEIETIFTPENSKEPTKKDYKKLISLLKPLILKLSNKLDGNNK